MYFLLSSLCLLDSTGSSAASQALRNDLKWGRGRGSWLKCFLTLSIFFFFLDRTERNFPFPPIPTSQTLPHTLSVCSNSPQLGALGAGFCPLWDKSKKRPVSGQGWEEFQPQKSPSPARRKEEGHCLKIRLWVPTPRVLVPLPLFYWDLCWKPNNPQVPQP